MKRILAVFIIGILFSCGEKKKNLIERETQVELGEKLFNGKGMCFSCHKPNQKIIGPSIEEIAKIYKEKNAGMVLFLKGTGKPIVEPGQYDVMKSNLVITKAMSDEDLEALEAYFYSFLK